MVIGKGLSKIYGGNPVFESIDFKLGNNKKVALVGKNGCGKSTLLKLIVGDEVPDKGVLQIENEKIAYIPQEFSFEDELVGEFIEKHLENSWDFYKVDQLVQKLEFKNFDIYQNISTLSEGQKMKLKILELMLGDPTILLIDEPTNHLDIQGIFWFEKYIKNLDKTVLLISHDREFLNNTVDQIWEIDNKKLYTFAGDYDDYKQEKLRLINKWDENYTRFLKRKKQLEALLKRSKLMNISRSGKGTQSIKNRIKREIEGRKQEKYENTKVKEINFESGICHSKLMVRFDNVSKSFGKTTVFKDLNFEIRGGQKVWLFGPNGGGKSTIVKLIVGEFKKTSGELKIADNILIGYYAQKHNDGDTSINLLELFIKETGCYIYDAYGYLKNYLFTKDDLQKRVNNLSPGQRARFYFAIFAYKNYDMLILDEPDNHLDIDTKEVLENSLANYKGTLLLISHDRFFVERSGVNKVLNLSKGKLSEY